MVLRLQFYTLKRTTYLLGLLLTLPSVATAQTEPPQFMTVDGRLYDSNTPEDPLLDNSVLMQIQVLNPAKTCILYEEEQTVSTLSSNGYFNVRVGSPTSGGDSLKRTTNDSGNSMMEVFQNQAAVIAGRTSGGAVCSFTPSAGDSRHFRFTVTPSTTGVTSTLSPDMAIDSVPQSLVAETLQGMTPTDFVQTNTNVTQAKVNSLFGASYAGLTGLLAGSSSLYLQNTTNGTVIPGRTTNPLTPSAGQIWYDSDDNVLRYYDGTIVQTLSSGSSDPTKLPLAGGTMAGAIDMGTNDITDIGHMTQAAQRTFRFGAYTTAQQATLVATPLVAGHEGTVWYNTTTNKLMFWDGTAEFAVAPVDSVFGRTGAVVAAASDYDANQIDNTAAGTIAATDVQAAINELDSEKVAKAGDTMTGQLNMGPKGVAAGDGGAIAFTELAAGGTNTAKVRAPDALGANYVLTLPANDGDSGQYLQTDGNGVLSWVTPAGVGETNTASNQGAGGVGVFKQKTTFDLEFRNINAASNKVSVALDAGNNEIDINVAEANLDPAVIPNTAAGTIAATNVQAAINELDSEKVASTRAINTAAGSGLAGGGDLSADRSLSVNITGTAAETAVAGTDEILIYDASATALRKMTRTNFVLSETEVDAMVSNNGYLSAEVDTLATVTGRGATTATSITLNTQAQARFADSAGGEYAAIQAPATIGSNYVLTLPDAAGTNGQVLSTNGSGVLSWIAIPSAPVTSVFGRSGAVVAAASDYDANQIDNTPAGSIAANDVQAAINELDSEKVAKAGDTMTGQLNMGPKGVAAGDGGAIAFTELAAGGTNTATVRAPDALGANYVLTLPLNDGDSGQYLQTDGNGVLAWVTPAGVGETNTASNQGAGGVGVFKQKTTFDLEFRNINAASNKITVALDAGNNEIDINVAEANLNLGAIPNTPAGTIAATNAQAAINELDSEKVASARAINTAAGSGLSGGGDLSADRSLSVNINGITAETTAAANDELLIYDTSATALRKMARSDFLTGYLTAEADTLASVTGRGATTATSITLATQAQARFADSAGGEYAAIQAPATISTNYVLTLPDTAGTNGQLLSTNGSGVLSWIAIPSAPVTSVFSRTGAVVATASDYDANQIDNTPAGAIAASDVQAAINELDTEKVAKAGDTMTGALNIDNEQELRLSEADGSGANYVAIKALTTLGANYTLTLPADAGAVNQVLTTNGSGVLSWTTPAAVGETNTASNQGVGGVGFYDAKSGVDLQFRNLNAASNKVSVALDAANKEIDINVNEANFDPAVIPTTAAGTIAATNVQAAINELDSEKVAKAGDTMTGQLSMGPKGVAPGDGGAIAFTELAAGGTNTAIVRAPDALGANYLLTLPANDGDSGQYLQTDGNGVLSWVTPAGVGETNTASNQGAGGVGVFKQKTTFDLEFRNINAASNKISVALDVANNEIDINLAEANLDLGAIPNTPAGTIAATTAQAAINELDIDKVAKTGDSMSGALTFAAQNQTRFADSAGGEYAAIQAPATIGTNYVLTLPDTAGSASQVLTTNGSGVLSWTTPSTTPGADSLDFTLFADAMTLDASTDIAASGTNVLSITNGGTGNSFVVNDVASDTSPFVIDASGNVGIGTTVPGTPLDVVGAITSRPGGIATGQTGQLILRELVANGVNTFTLRAPDTLTTDRVLTFPDSNGTTGQVLQTDGAGVLSWATPSAAGITALTGDVTASGSGSVVATIANNTVTDAKFRQGAARSVVGVTGNSTANVADIQGTANQVLRVNGSGTALAFGAIDLSSSAAVTGALGVTNGGTGQTTANAAFNALAPNQAANNGRFLTTDGTNTSWAAPGTRLSNLTSAIATNTLANGDFGQIWDWDGLTSQTAMRLRTNSATSGTLLSLTNSYNNASSAGRVLKIDVTGTSNAAVPFMITNAGTANTLRLNDDGTDTDATPFVVDANGNVGIGTTGPGTILDVAGAITSRPFGTTTGQTGQLIMRELVAGGTDTVAIRAPDAIGTSYALTLPATAGAANQVLTTDGAGILSWTSGGAASIANNSLNFDKFIDAMTLDASTDIAATGTNVLSITNSGTGDSFRVNDSAGDTSPFLIDADGDVGIGTTVPDVPFHFINSASKPFKIERNTPDNIPAEFTLYKQRGIGSVPSDDTEYARINFDYVDGGPVQRTAATIAASVDGSVGVNDTPSRLGFFTTLDGTNTNVERMRITNTGSVSIGTSAPGTLLDVAGAITSRPFGTTTGQTGQLIMRELAASGTDTVAIRAPDAIGTSYSLTLPTTAGSSGQVLRTDGAGLLTWVNSDAGITADVLDFTQFSDTMTLDASTNIAASGTNVLSITNTGTGDSFRVNDEAGDTTPFVVDASGSVGVGTTTPGNALHIANGSVRVQPDASWSSGDVARIFFGDTAKLIRGNFNGSLDIVSENTLSLFSDNTERIRIATSTGFVGIGTTSPRGLLDVNGTIVMKPSTSNAGATIDFGTGNLQHTALDCQAFILHNMKDGGSYTLAVKGTTVATCSFTAFSDAGGSQYAGVNVHMPVDHAATITGRHTIYTFLVMGGDVYITWMPGL